MMLAGGGDSMLWCFSTTGALFALGPGPTNLAAAAGAAAAPIENHGATNNQLTIFLPLILFSPI